MTETSTPNPPSPNLTIKQILEVMIERRLELGREVKALTYHLDQIEKTKVFVTAVVHGAPERGLEEKERKEKLLRELRAMNDVIELLTKVHSQSPRQGGDVVVEWSLSRHADSADSAGSAGANAGEAK